MALTDSSPTQDAAGLSIGDTRLIQAGRVVRSTAGVPRLGILPAHTNALVTGTAGMAYSVAPFNAVASRTGVGVEEVANDAATSVATTVAPGANSRVDVIWFRPQFVASTDAANVPLFGVTQGTAAASPVKPSIPTGALELATATVLSSTTQTSTTVITQTFLYTAMEGGVVLLRNATEAAAWSPHDGSVAYRLDLGVSMVRFSGVWDRVNTGLNLVGAASFSAVAAVNVDGIFTSLFNTYTIEFEFDAIAAKSLLYMQLRAGAVTNTAAAYYYQLDFGAGSTAAAAGVNATNRWQLTTQSADMAKLTVNLASPATVIRTTGLVESMSWDTAVGPTMGKASAGLSHGTGAAYDGFSLNTGGAPVMTGRYRIYGHYAG